MAKTTRRLRAGLLEACDSKALLSFDLWKGQRELLAAIEEGPRIHVWALGRRSGKTTLAALCCLWDALLRPDLDGMVRPGETRFAVGVATNLQQARLLISAARSIVEASPGLAPLVSSATDDEIRFLLPSGAKTAVRAFPCSSRGARGWPISTVVMDEAAHFISETDGYQTSDKVFEALAPATAQFREHARIILCSTPYGTEGLFADLFRKCESGELANGRSHHAPTVEINPTITPEFLATEEARDPEGFRQEYGAEFTGSGDAYLDFSLFEIGPPGEVAPHECQHWVAGLDPSFSSDPFGVAVVGRDPFNSRQLKVGAVRAWKPQRRKATSFEEVASVQEETLAGIIEFLEPYEVARALTDQYAARGVLDRLSRGGIYAQQLAMSATTKTAIYSELRARLYDGSLILPDHPDLVAELRRLRSRFAAGSASVVNPRVGGSHGDMGQALAMAVYALRGGGGTGRKVRGGGRQKRLPGGVAVSLTEKQFDDIAEGGIGSSRSRGKWSRH
jgi:hypothetical protein